MSSIETHRVCFLCCGGCCHLATTLLMFQKLKMYRSPRLWRRVTVVSHFFVFVFDVRVSKLEPSEPTDKNMILKTNSDLPGWGWLPSWWDTNTLYESIPTFALNWFSSPFSCPTMMNSPRGPQTALVILDSLQGTFMYGSLSSGDKRKQGTKLVNTDFEEGQFPHLNFDSNLHLKVSPSWLESRRSKKLTKHW